MHIADLMPYATEQVQVKKHIGNLLDPTLAMSIVSVFERHEGSLLVICASAFDVLKLIDDIRCLNPAIDIKHFKDYETLPYDSLSPHQDIISSRLELLSTIGAKKELIICSVSTVMSRLCPVDYIVKKSFLLKVGDRRDISQLKSRLVEHGYVQVTQVLEHGEFALRGSILDIFPMGSDEPYRIDFFDDEVDSIATFDLESQRSVKKTQSIKLLPAHEFPLDEEGIAIFRSRYRDYFVNANLQKHTIYQAISKGAIPAGIEYYLPLFFASTSTLFDYIADTTAIVLAGDVMQGANDFDVEVHKRASLFAGNSDHPPLPAYSVFLSPKELFDCIKVHDRIYLNGETFSDDIVKKRGYSNAKVSKIDDIAFSHNKKDSSERFVSFVTDYIAHGGRILISAISEGRRQSLKEIIPGSLYKSFNITPASSVQDFLDKEDPLMLTIAPFSSGAILDKHKLCFITETEIFGQQVVKQKKERSRRFASQDAIIKNLAQLSEDQIVVHIDHGIGRYKGLVTLTINGVKGEYLTIEYQNGDTLNIPITSLNKIARYAGSENPVLSKLGNDSWSRKKHKAATKVLDVAAKLLDLYAMRQSRQGQSFNVDKKALDEFASGFGYEETADQRAAIDATIADMCSNEPMDRLICGDVGFGKTEVALRSAFVCANAGYQVALLVPTTILAEQHYQNFKDRFSGTAIEVEVLSRFKSTAEQNAVLKKVESGAIDIIIGTHKLLSKSVHFKALGLVIVDEEHRFGVKQKERLKELRAEVDILTLTATPIPRTLNMAMEGMRQLSIIATPPEHRLAVKTFVQEDSDSLCREAIVRELRRGGQVYYLHNDVATIHLVKQRLEKLVPEARIDIGHGQMKELELKKVMRDFYHQRFNVLLCTTIIENGLDVPTANTIIIDRAERLGLAQLHQIRGRVGRSHHQAYAYLFTGPKDLMTKDARRRLDAIASLDELGAGFVLATHDLEIRGAGEILGEEQSGQIESIGFSLYMEMLNAAIKALKDGREPSLNEITLNECEIDMRLPCLIPEDYMGDINTRLSIYKRLSSCVGNEDFEDLKVELIDRFGFLSEPIENLFYVSRLKRLASRLGIVRIAGDENGGLIEFAADHKVKVEYLTHIITSCRHNEYRLSGPNMLRYNIPESKAMPRLVLLERILKALGANSSLATGA